VHTGAHMEKGRQGCCEGETGVLIYCVCCVLCVLLADVVC
jgi:hypothetical protein